jgi:hypothetical protein
MDAYMARINFTATRIADYKCDESKQQSFLWDSTAHCLALRATANGSKAYIFQAKLHGNDIRTTIGSPADWSLQQARAEANRLKVMIDQGIDPRAIAAEQKARSAAKSAEKSAKKLLAREAWDAYMAAPHPKWGAVHRQDHINAAQEGGTVPKIGKGLTKPGPLASLLCMPLNEITHVAVAAWLKKESALRSTAAANSFRKFRAFINWCNTQPQFQIAIHADCCLVASVKDIVPPSLTKAGDCLQKEQLALWFTHVRQISNPVFSAYLQALLLTGARRSEMLLLKWADIDFQWKLMKLYDTEEDTGERTIPLTPYLASVLESLPRINEWVFSSATATKGHVIGVTKPHTQALEKAGLPHVSLHGLRRSFATLSEWIEVPGGVAAQIQGHKPSALREKHYIFRPIDLLRMHHVKIETWMLEQAGIDFAEKAAA